MRRASVLLLASLTAACSSHPGPRPVPPPPRAYERQSGEIAPAAPFCPARGYEAAGRANAASLRTLSFAPFSRVETGWEVYAPAVAREIGTDCTPESPAFARALAVWQQARRLPADGIMTVGTFAVVKAAWQDRRPFLRLRTAGVCPAAPDEDRLATADPRESRWDKPVRMRRGALAAWRGMVAAARRERPELAVDPEALKIFSAFRAPAADAARCAAEGNCNGVVRASCSAHRTGLAVDMLVGFAPGFRADSTDDANRLYQSRTVAYRWMIANADRFGFTPYLFEPWHWEWTGEAP